MTQYYGDIDSNSGDNTFALFESLMSSFFQYNSNSGKL